MKSFATLLLFISTFYTVLGQPGANDPNFNDFDNGTYGNGYGMSNPQVWDIAVQQDGKIIVGGQFVSYNGVAAERIARLNVDGSLDTSFHSATGFDSDVKTISIQNDGKIIVGGNFLSYKGIPVYKLVRLNSDGSLDASFVTGSFLNLGVSDSEIQPDGKILITGQFTFTFNGNGYFNIARLNTNGTPDNTFYDFEGFNNQLVDASIQPDGKIIVCGSFNTYYSSVNTSIKGIARLQTNGGLDNSFNPGTGSNYNVYASETLPNGKIIAGGNFTSFNGIPFNKIVCLNSNGSLDNSFNIGSGFSGGFVWAISIQSDGKIIVGGDFTSFNGVAADGIIRLNQDGSRDMSFNTTTLTSTSTVFSTTIDPNGRIFAAGSLGYALNGVLCRGFACFNTMGNCDSIFHFGTGFNYQVYSTAIQADGKIVVGGKLWSFNGIKELDRIARLNTDGTLDLTFDTGSGFDQYVTSVAIQQDGKIICGGDFTLFNGNTIRRIVRLNQNGTQDMTFNPGTGANFFVHCISMQPDGKLIVGGEFSNINNIARNCIVRLNNNGSVDPTFTIGTGFSSSGSSVYATAIQTNGQIIAGGYFTMFNGTSVNRIARLNSNGSLDPGFSIGSGFNNPVYAIKIQTDGKIIIGGSFTAYNGTSSNHIIRLNSDGNQDLTFNIGSGFNGDVNAITTQSDGRIIVAGSFSSYNGFATGSIVRLNTDGSVDTTFNTGTGFNNVAVSLSVQADDKIIVGGNFTTYNGKFKNRIIRILNTCPTINPNPLITNISCYGAQDGSIHLNPTGGTAPYFYDWGDGFTSGNRTGLNGGNYSAIVSDANGCTTNFSTTLIVPSTTISASTQVTDVSCYGGNNGGINITATSGNGPCTFVWENGQISEDISGLTAGTYNVIISDSTGCLLLQSTINQPSSAIQGSAIVTNVSCNGGNDGEIAIISNGGTSPYFFDWGGGITTQDRTSLTAGTYPVTITDDNGCSLVISSIITEPSSIVDSINVTTCGLFTWNQQNYTSTGQYIQFFNAANGCDSTVLLNLIVNNPTTGLITQTACNSFTINGQTYTSSGTYNQYLTNSNGCDSILTINLAINNTTSNSITQTTCESYSLNGQTYTSSGTYFQYLTNSNGCDSLVTLNLTINSPTTATINAAACGSYSLNGQTYTSSGTFIHNLINNAGCDSTLTLVLEINNAPDIMLTDDGNGTITASDCDFYQWIDCSTSNIIAGETAPSYPPTQNGTYAVIGTTLNSCSDTSECIEIDYLDVDKKTLLQISLVPNPTEDIVSIFFDKSSAQLMVHDSQGKQILYKLIMSGEQISLLNYADGVYLFEIKTDESSTTHKILKQ